jgi:predicted protein tyrosine phosphatase
MRHYLFVCSQNRLRSPTAEHIFAEVPGIVTASAGTNNDAENPLTDELVNWADFVFVMERQHRGKLQQKHKAALKDKRLIVLGIPDDYAFMDPALVRLLRAKMLRWLPKN